MQKIALAAIIGYIVAVVTYNIIEHEKDSTYFTFTAIFLTMTIANPLVEKLLKRKNP